MANQTVNSEFIQSQTREGDDFPSFMCPDRDLSFLRWKFCFFKDKTDNPSSECHPWYPTQGTLWSPFRNSLFLYTRLSYKFSCLQRPLCPRQFLSLPMPLVLIASYVVFKNKQTNKQTNKQKTVSSEYYLPNWTIFLRAVAQLCNTY